MIFLNFAIIIVSPILFMGCKSVDNSDIVQLNPKHNNCSAKNIVTVSAKYKSRIKSLISEVKIERDNLSDEGFDDGNGLLYMSTKAFKKLIDICSENELLEAHKELAPSIYSEKELLEIHKGFMLELRAQRKRGTH